LKTRNPPKDREVSVVFVSEKVLPFDIKIASVIAFGRYFNLEILYKLKLLKDNTIIGKI
jgi:hypothetical protein